MGFIAFVFITIALAYLRLVGVTSSFYQAIAHVFTGAVLSLYIWTYKFPLETKTKYNTLFFGSMFWLLLGIEIFSARTKIMHLIERVMQ